MTIGTGNIEESDGVAIGTSNQANSQQVTIHMEAPPATAPVKEQLGFQTRAIMNLQQMFTSDRAERIPIQEEAARWRKQTQYWLIGLTLLIGGLVLIDIIAIGRFLTWW